MSGTPFIIFGLPRSRTFWLSKFLSHGQWKCYHDRSVWMRSLGDIKAWFSQEHTGTVETAAAPFWRYIHREFPHVKFIVVRRPVEECLDSWMRAVPWDNAHSVKKSLEKLNRKLDQIERRVPNVFRVEFDKLSMDDTASALFFHCTGRRLLKSWSEAMLSKNEQVNIKAQLRYVRANAPAIEKLYKHIASKEFSALNKKIPASDSITFSRETFDSCWADAKKLFESHMIVTGQDIDGYLKKNLPLIKILCTSGVMKIMGARCNGRLVGYLFSIIAPSMDEEGILAAEHTSMFCDAAFSGTGSKLMRAAEDALIKDGVSVAFARAGIRGDGDRIGILYNRRGYEEFGQLYRKELQ